MPLEMIDDDDDDDDGGGDDDGVGTDWTSVVC